MTSGLCVSYLGISQVVTPAAAHRCSELWVHGSWCLGQGVLKVTEGPPHRHQEDKNTQNSGWRCEEFVCC